MKAVRNEEGFVLVVALLVMVVLSVIGIAATKTAFLEREIATNDRVYKKSLYQAEAGSILTSNVVEESINCPVGFGSSGNENDPFNDGDISVADLEGAVRVYSRGTGKLALYYQGYPEIDNSGNITDEAGNDLDANIGYPVADLGDTVGTGTEETYVWAGGGAKMLPGGALEMLAGYEGRGKSAAASGTQRDYTIIAKHYGEKNSESVISLNWRHVIGSETYDCKYE